MIEEKPDPQAANAFGVTIVRGVDRDAISRVFEEDYRHLRGVSGFIRGRLVESSSETGVFFHLTEWETEEQFSQARRDPVVAEILETLPVDTGLESHPCSSLVSSEELGQ